MRNRTTSKGINSFAAAVCSEDDMGQSDFYGTAKLHPIALRLPALFMHQHHYAEPPIYPSSRPSDWRSATIAPIVFQWCQERIRHPTMDPWALNRQNGS